MEELIPHSWFFGLHEEDVGVGRPGKVLHEWRAVLIAVHLGHHQVFHLHDQAELRVNMREHRLPSLNVWQLGQLPLAELLFWDHQYVLHQWTTGETETFSR